MAVLSPLEVYSLARSRGFSPADSLVIVGIVGTESGGKTDAVEPGGQGRGILSIDLGQHPDVTEAEAFDPVWSLDWLMRNGGPTKVTFYGPRDHPQVASDWKKQVMAANPEAQRAGDSQSTWQKVVGTLASPLGTPLDQTPGPSVSTATLGTIYDAVKALPAAAAWLSRPHNWLRMAEVLIGVALVLAGMWRLSPGLTEPVKTAAKRSAELVAVA